MTGYVRQSSADIVPTAVVRAAPLNNEFNTLRDAFSSTGGHKHDGTTAEGVPVPVMGDSDLLNKIATDTTNNRHGVFVEVGAAAVEQVRFQDGAIVPVTDNDIDLGTSSLEFKDLYIDGTANIDSLIADTADINAGTIDNTVIGATTPVAATVTNLTVNTAATIASADINAGTIDGAVIGGASAQAITGTTITANTGFVGGLTGNVTGNVTGNLTGNVTGVVTGSLTGNVTASSGTSTFNDVVINGGLNMNAGTSATITNLTSPTNSGDAATKGYVDTSISALLDSAPGALDTLNELAAALGDDPNFATTVTNEIATKVSKSGDTMSGVLAMGTNKITGLGNPTANQDAATKTYVDTADALNLPKAGGTMTGAIAMGTNKITGMGDPTNAQDAATKNYIDVLFGSTTSAATSAASAATSASSASTSASSASTSASAASASASSAAASYDSFDDRYLGPKSSAPTVDNDGNTLLTGAIYWNSTSNNLFIWTGSTWTSAAFTASGFLVNSNNLSDVSDAATARTNLGLGTAATTASTAYATAAQGTKADTALQPAAIGVTVQAYNADTATTNTAQTLTNKTIAYADNTLTGVQPTLVSGTSIKTINGSSVLGSGNISLTSLGAGGVVITGNTTLTSTSDAAITVTPTSFGMYATLPDATTCSEGDNLFSIYNAGDYDYGVKSSTGVKIGWVRPRTGAMIGLSDNSTAAGVWSAYGLEEVGTTAEFSAPSINNLSARITRVALDSNRTLILFGRSDLYGVVYDASSLTWGSATLIRSGLSTDTAFDAVLSGTNQVLTVSFGNTNQMHVGVLTISGTTISNIITVSIVIAGTYSTSSVVQLIAVGSSYVVSYGRATNVSAIRAITISAGVPTIGSEATLSPSVTTAALLFASGSVVRTFVSDTGSLYARPFTVSGVTLTAGTAATLSVTAAAFRAFQNGNGNIVANYLNSGHTAAVFKLTGTTEAGSTVSLGTAPTNALTNADYVAVSASKTLFASYISATSVQFNILVDTAGTASVGTELSLPTNITTGAIAGLFTASNIGYVALSNNSGTQVFSINCSSTSPTLSGIKISTAFGVSVSDLKGIKSPRYLSIASTTTVTLADGFYTIVTPLSSIRYAGNNDHLLLPIATNGVADGGSGVFTARVGTISNSTGIQIQRIEAAA